MLFAAGQLSAGNEARWVCFVAIRVESFVCVLKKQFSGRVFCQLLWHFLCKKGLYILYFGVRVDVPKELGII